MRKNNDCPGMGPRAACSIFGAGLVEVVTWVVEGCEALSVCVPRICSRKKVDITLWP